MDIVVDGETGFLVNEHEMEQMAEKMIYLLENTTDIKKMGNNGRKFIADNFSMQKHISDVSNAIKNSLKL